MSEDKVRKAELLEKMAGEFLNENKEAGKPFLYYQSKFWQYIGTHYSPVEDIDILVNKRFTGCEAQSTNDRREIINHMKKRCVLSAHVQMPVWLNGGRDAVIPYRNGLLNVQTWELVPHTHQYFASFCLPFAYDPLAQCPQWQSFVTGALESPEDILTLQEWFGHCLTSDASYQKMLVMVGQAGSGKSTINSVLSKLVGDENYIGYDLVRLGERFGLCALVGRQLATVSEIELKGNAQKSQILSRLKSIIGHDAVSVEWKGINEVYNVVLPVKFSMACNELPMFYDTTGAVNRRLLVLFFTKPILAPKHDFLSAVLLPELAGINNWALEGLKRLREQAAFTESEKMQELLTDQRRDSSPEWGFAVDCLVVQKPFAQPGVPMKVTEEAVSVSSETLAEIYHRWCHENSAEGSDFRWVIRNIHTLLPRLPKASRRMVNGKQMYFHAGIAIKAVS